MNKRIVLIITILLMVTGFAFQKSAFPEPQDNQAQQNLQSISSEDLERGWYYGSLNQKKDGTPDDWIHDRERTRSACWHKPGVRCGQELNKRPCAKEGDMCGGIAGILCCPGLSCKLAGNYPDASGICVEQSAEQGNKHP
jgi:hypothetical protein